MRPRTLTFLLVIAASASFACGPAGPVRVDLVEALGEAEVFTETGLIDVGERRARRFLLDGWLEMDERWARRPDESFVWTTGAAVSFRFFVFESRDLVMSLRARPLPDGDVEGREFAIELDGQLLARHTILPGWNDYRATVPRQVVRPGENRVRLIFPEGQGGEARGRRLAVERIEFTRTIVRYPVRREIGAPALVAPYLSGAWYELESRPGDRLYIAEILPYGPHADEPAGELHIVLETPAGEERLVAEPGGSFSLPLPEDLQRLGLIAMPAGDPRLRSNEQRIEEAVGLLLRRPAILGSR